MNRTEKAESMEQLRKDTDAAQLLIVMQMSGLNAGTTATLRRKSNEQKTKIQVVKNRLGKLAFKGTRFEELSNLLKGPTAIAYSTDPIAAAKVVADFSNDNDKVQILGGLMGDKTLTAANVIALSKLPGLNELRGKLVGLLQAPATKIACVVQAPAGQLARVFAAYGNKA